MRTPPARRIFALAIALAIALTACDTATNALDPLQELELAQQATRGPTHIDDCREGGWRDYGFRNQGQCVASIVANNRITSVTIDGGDRTIVLGDPLTLTATVATNGNASDAVAWTSSDETVATIDATGLVTTIAAGTTQITATSTSNPSKSDTITLTIDTPGALRWTEQFGSSSIDFATGVATDTDGNVYVTGYTFGDLDGTTTGFADAFLRAYDASGTPLWTRQFGSTSRDYATGVATDTDGNVYVTGYTLGALDGANNGNVGAFLRAYDRDGTELWTHQFGTTAQDQATGVTTDTNGHVYVTGYTFGTTTGFEDAFLRAYDASGTPLWTRQFGSTSSDYATGVATDTDGNVYVTGYTFGTTTGFEDAFLRAYDRDGTPLWTEQFGTAGNDIASGVATDANGHIYVTGYTFGALDGTSNGTFDAFLRAYDRDGTELWTHQFGSTSNDYAAGVATDTDGRVYVTGYTGGALEGTNNGRADAFLRAYDRDGTELWTRQFGTINFDNATGVATDTHGNVYVAGTTDGDLEGTNNGSYDAFLRAYQR